MAASRTEIAAEAIYRSITDEINKQDAAIDSIIKKTAANNNLNKIAVELAKEKLTTEDKLKGIETAISNSMKNLLSLESDRLAAGRVSVADQRAYVELRNTELRLLGKLKAEQEKLQSLGRATLAVQNLGLKNIVEKTREYQKLWAENKFLVIGMAGLAIWKKIFDVFKNMDNAAADFRMSVGATRKYTEEIDKQARSIAFEFAQMGVNAAMAYISIAEIGKTLGSIAFASKDVTENVALMNAQFGIAQSTSAEFLKNMGIASKESVSLRKHSLLFVQSLSDAAGTNLGEVMSDVNNATKSSYSYITRSSLGLIKAAVEARRMGTSIESTVGTSKSLLSFTKSVNSEMEASVLLGESINLQRARELSYRRDLAGLNKEILKIMKETDFESLDPFQQEAVAAALGKSASELSSMAQAERQRLDLERDMSASTQEQLRAYKAMTQTNESNAKALANNAKEQLKIKSNQAAIASITASWNAILQRVGEVFLPTIAKVLSVVSSTLSGINKFIEANPWAKWVLAIGAVVAGVVAIGVALMSVMKVMGALGKLGGGVGGGIAGAFEGLANGVSAMGSGAVLKGAFNLLILSASLIPLALALKLMEGVSLKTVGIMVLALAAVVGVVILLGSPKVALLAAVGTAILIGIAAAMVIFAAAAWIGSKAMQNLSDVKWMDVAKGLFAVGIQSPLILGMGLAMGLAAPGILMFSLALIPLSMVAKKTGDAMMSMGMGFKLVVDSIERLANVSLIGTILQVRSLASAVSDLSKSLNAMPDIQVEKIERMQMKSAAGDAQAAGGKDSSLLDEIKGMRAELQKLREGIASGALKATVNIDSQKVDAATGRSLEFKGVLV